MAKDVIERNIIQSFAEQFSGGAAPAEVNVRPLRGGLDSCGIKHVQVRWSRKGRQQSGGFVAKKVSGTGKRELAIYQQLAGAGVGLMAPELLGFHQASSTEAYLFLEWVRSHQRWPWRDAANTRRVIQHLAALHSRCKVDRFAAVFQSWDYEAELQESAALTVAMYERAVLAGRRPSFRPMSPALKRLSSALPAIRTELFQACGVAVLHGDVHPGNVVIRGSGKRKKAILLDWGRARLGSPLEDLSSWLQTLGYWEPRAKRLHDTFLREYFEYAGWNVAHSGIRRYYWLAGATNALAGALRYHLAVMLDSDRSPSERKTAEQAASDWLRVLRRADDHWRT